MFNDIQDITREMIDTKYEKIYYNYVYIESDF